MHGAARTSTFTIPAPFEQALSTVKRALAEAGLEPVPVLNVSHLVGDRLGVVMPPCTVLLVSPRVSPSEECAAAVLPLHVAVSAHGKSSQVHIVGSQGSDALQPPAGGTALLGRFHGEVSEVLSRIAMRQLPAGAF